MNGFCLNECLCYAVAIVKNNSTAIFWKDLLSHCIESGIAHLILKVVHACINTLAEPHTYRG